MVFARGLNTLVRPREILYTGGFLGLVLCAYGVGFDVVFLLINASVRSISRIRVENGYVTPHATIVAVRTCNIQ